MGVEEREGGGGRWPFFGRLLQLLRMLTSCYRKVAQSFPALHVKQCEKFSPSKVLKTLSYSNVKITTFGSFMFIFGGGCM